MTSPSAHAQRDEAARTHNPQGKSTQAVDEGRRRLLGHLAFLGAATLVAPGVHLLAVPTAEGKGADGTKRWGMLIDANRCDPNCQLCVTACHEENGLPPADNPQAVRWIRKVTLREQGSNRRVTMPVMCLHCAHPPCQDVCPTGATFKRKDGIVLVNRHTCIGCRYCVMACPYKARNFVYSPVTTQKSDVPRGIGCAEGCTLCVHRIDRGQLPACVERCPNQVLLFGDLNDPTSAIRKRMAELGATALRPDLRLDPSVRFYGV